MASWFDNLRDKAVDAGMSKAKTAKAQTSLEKPGPDAERVAANRRRLDNLRQIHDDLSSHKKAPTPKAESPQEQQLRRMLERSHENPETPEEAAAWKEAQEAEDAKLREFFSASGTETREQAGKTDEELDVEANRSPVVIYPGPLDYKGAAGAVQSINHGFSTLARLAAENALAYNHVKDFKHMGDEQRRAASMDAARVDIEKVREKHGNPTSVTQREGFVEEVYSDGSSFVLASDGSMVFRGKL